MADTFAAEGYTTLVLDLFNGDPVPLNKPAGFDIMSWISKGSDGQNPHTKEFVDPIIVSGIKTLQSLGIKKIGAAGYCFGAKVSFGLSYYTLRSRELSFQYVVRHYKDGIDVGYLAHPSFVEEEELAAITGPLAISAAETDSIFPTEKRHKSEEILAKTKQPYQITLFQGVEHGFSVRGDPKIKATKFAKEQAFQQAMTWFDEFLVNA